MALQGVRTSSGSCLEEGRRLKDLLECIPRTTGVFKTTKLTLTCVDAADELLVIGSNAGTIYVYEKNRKRTGVLPTQGRSNSISCVKLCEPKQRVAFGCVSGAVFIFQFQLQVGHKLKILTLNKDHLGNVTCLAWHGDGEFLVSGDEHGKVNISAVDFVKNRCIVRLLHKADCSIVQISAGVAEDWIVVSTMKRSLLVSSQLHLRKEPIAIGQKDRKSGPFGACLWGNSKEEVLVYVARPGLRLWKASLYGKVSATLQYRDLLSSGQGPIIQMYSVHSSPVRQCVDGQFHGLHVLAGKYIVTHCDNILWILDPDNNSVLGCHGNIGKIVDVAATKTEIFVLREDAECPILMLTFHPSFSDVKQSSVQESQTEISSTEISSTDKSREAIELQPAKEESFQLQVTGQLTTNLLSASDEQLQKVEGSLNQDELPSQHQEVTVNSGEQADVDEVVLQSQTGENEEKHCDEESYAAEKLMKRDSFFEKALKRERFEQISQSVFSDEIVFNPKKERKKKKSKQQQKKKSKSTLALATILPDGSEYDGIRATSTEPDFLADTAHSVPVSRDGSPDSGREVACNVENENVKITVEHFDQQETLDMVSVAAHYSGRNSFVSHANGGLSPVIRQKSPCDIKRYESPTYQQNAVGDYHSARSSPVSQLDRFSPDEVKEKESPCVSPIDYTEDSPGSTGCNSPLTVGHTGQVAGEEHVSDVTDIVGGAMVDIETGHTDESSLEQQKRDVTTLSQVERSDKVAEVPPPVVSSIYDKFKWEDSLSSLVTEKEQDNVDDEKPEGKSTEHEHSSSMATMTFSAYGSSMAVTSSLSQSVAMVDSGDQRLMDGWTPYPYPSKFHINCAALSKNHVFVIDSRDRTFMAKVGESSGKWKKIEGYFKQISVSPNGLHILGVTGRSHLYVRLGVTSSNPSGKGWEKIADEVVCIAAEDNQMWALRREGSVFYSAVIPIRERQRPRWASLENALGLAQSFVQVTACKGVVWARDKSGLVYYRAGISTTQRQGNRWKLMDDQLQCTHICLGGHQAGWAVSSSGTVLFKHGVTTDKPAGEPRWWEIVLSDYRVEDLSLINSLLSWVRPADSSLKLVVANADAGVCVLTGSSSIHISNTALLGNRYEMVNIQGIPQSASNWLCVAAGSLSSPETGVVWAVRRNGEIFCLPPTARPFSIDPPSSKKVTLLTASEVALWALVGNRVMVREGINSYCPAGISWTKADTTTMNHSPVTWLSCGMTTVWAIDQAGRVWLRLVTNPSQHAHSSPVWLEIEGRLLLGCPLHRVAVAPDDSMVWAVDTKGNVYVRTEVSEKLPAGGDWEYVAGAQVKELVASRVSVWAISLSGEMLCRFGISQSNCLGDYWKKVVGTFNQISVTSFDQLWGVDKDGQMFSRHTNAYMGSQVALSRDSLDGWDVI